MDLYLIILSMSFGGFICGVLGSQAGPEIGFVAGIGGTFLGGAFAYMLMYSVKKEEVEAQKRNLPLPAPVMPQIVGSLCASCHQRIMMITDANVCESCLRVFCRQCQQQVPCSECLAWHAQQQLHA